MNSLLKFWLLWIPLVIAMTFIAGVTGQLGLIVGYFSGLFHAYLMAKEEELL